MGVSEDLSRAGRGGVGGTWDQGDELNELALSFKSSPPAERESGHGAATTLDWRVFIGKAGVITLRSRRLLSFQKLSPRVKVNSLLSHIHTCTSGAQL